MNHKLKELQDPIFPVQPNDFARVVTVWEASVRATHNFLAESDIQYFKPLVRDKYLDMVELACMRDSADCVAGFVGVAESKVEMLFVDPSWFGNGIGRRLMLHATRIMGARLVDVNEQNEEAVGFYLHIGFEVFDRSELDGLGKPFPLLHMKLSDSQTTALTN